MKDLKSSILEDWGKEFDKKFVDKPKIKYEKKEPYKIGNRNYTGEKYILPGYKIKGTPYDIKQFISDVIDLVEKKVRDEMTMTVEYAEGKDTDDWVDVIEDMVTDDDIRKDERKKVTQEILDEIETINGDPNDKFTDQCYIEKDAVTNLLKKKL